MSNVLLRSGERDEYGLTATLRSENGQTYTAREFMGPVKAAVLELVAYCDRHSQRVVCISTPQTIYSDLQGRSLSGRRRQRITKPEEMLLGWVGRMDLKA